MPRKRIGDISESLEFLRRLENHYRRQPQEVRIRALRILREHPGMRIRDVAVRAECSESSVQRWWDLYRRNGIAAVIGATRLPAMLTDSERVEELRRILRRDDGARSQSASGEARLPVSPFLSDLAGHVPVGHVPAGNHPAGDRTVHDVAAPGRELPDAAPARATILEFLRSLPAAGGTRQWLETFREALRGMLYCVDRVTVSLNVECDVRNPDSYAPGIVVAQQVSDQMEPASVITSMPRPGGAGIASRFVGELRRRGLAVDSYQPPVELHYYINGTAYLGTIILWREARMPAIPERTLALMRDLEPMIVVLLSDCIARHQRACPLDRAFNGALRRLIQEAGLTDQEARIALMQLHGRSYKEIADLLDISLDTVGKHINSIHRKTRTRGHAELFAKYFTKSLGGGFLTADVSGSTGPSRNL